MNLITYNRDIYNVQKAFKGLLFVTFATQIMLRRKFFTGLFVAVFCTMGVMAYAQTTVDRKAFYEAMAGNKLTTIDAQLKNLQSITSNDKAAFEGAMLMRKAALIAVPAKKLSTFKAGNKKLELSITNNTNNIEYRFLRLIIQENAPKTLGYNKSIAADSKLVKEKFTTLSAATQQAIRSYSKSSPTLKGL